MDTVVLPQYDSTGASSTVGQSVNRAVFPFCFSFPTEPTMTARMGDRVTATTIFKSEHRRYFSYALFTSESLHALRITVRWESLLLERLVCVGCMHTCGWAGGTHRTSGGVALVPCAFSVLGVVNAQQAFSCVKLYIGKIRCTVVQ